MCASINIPYPLNLKICFKMLYPNSCIKYFMPAQLSIWLARVPECLSGGMDIDKAGQVGHCFYRHFVGYGNVVFFLYRQDQVNHIQLV